MRSATSAFILCGAFLCLARTPSTLAQGQPAAERRCVQGSVLFARSGKLTTETPRQRVLSVDLIGQDSSSVDRRYQIDLPGVVSGVGAFQDVLPVWSNRVWQFAGSVRDQGEALIWKLITTYAADVQAPCLASLSIDVPARSHSDLYALVVPNATQMRSVALSARNGDAAPETACDKVDVTPGTLRLTCSSMVGVQADLTPHQLEPSRSYPPDSRVSRLMGHGYRIDCINRTSSPVTCRIELLTDAYPPQRR